MQILENFHYIGKKLENEPVHLYNNNLTCVDKGPIIQVTYLSPIVRRTFESIIHIYANCYNY